MPKQFKRGLPKGALEYLKGQQWWQDLFDFRYDDGENTRPLLFALRNGYMNVYAEGQSVFKVGFGGPAQNLQEKCKIHRKYVLGPHAAPGYLDFDGEVLTDRENPAFRQEYSGPEMLGRWVSRAREHSGGEKRGVATIAAGNSNVIDVEMGLPSNATPGSGQTVSAYKMDVVALERDYNEQVQLVFYEAKLFSNGELKAKNYNPPVLEQLGRYQKYVSEDQRKNEVVDAYREVCRWLVELNRMRGFPSDPLVTAVAGCAPLNLDPKPRLIIYEYTDRQVRTPQWKAHEQVLTKKFTVIRRARAQDVRLSHAAEPQHFTTPDTSAKAPQDQPAPPALP